MKLGYISHHSDEALEVGTKIGFDCVELWGIQPLLITDDEIKAMCERVAEHNMVITSIQCSIDHMDADPAKRKDCNKEFIRALEIVNKFGCDIVMTNANQNRKASFSENLKTYKEVFGEYARAAEAYGAKIAIENCPHKDTDTMSFGNLAVTPELWNAMFEAVTSMSVGLEFDPSHLVWQEIDIPQAIYDFRDRIFCCHAKDTEVHYNYRSVVGNTIDKATPSKFGSCYWCHRIPGFGDIDWKAFFRALYTIGFDGPIVIEQEDDAFEGDRFNKGLELGHRFLRPFII